jgi:hypothetical protein
VCIGTTGSDETLVFPRGPSIPPDGAFTATEGVRFADVRDGLSNTLMVGEKHVPFGSLGLFPWDCGLYDGHNPACNTRAAGLDFPLAVARDDPGLKFGSAHPTVCQFVFCDGSVRPLAKAIDPATLALLSQRNDGQPVPDF